MIMEGFVFELVFVFDHGRLGLGFGVGLELGFGLGLELGLDL